MLRHVILLRAAQVSQEKLNELFTAFLTLKNKVPGVMGFSTGGNVNGSLVSQGFTHVLMMDFVDKDYFDYYHKQPDYEQIRQLLRTLLPDQQNIIVLDYQIE